MAGDYTRFTFKPQRDYSGVFKQQGRVDLDADFNELIEIVDRRWRSETIDIINHCVVPNTTPDAFLITPTAMGAFDIGIGRMYVDGIQVENHGLPPLEYQADLGEMRGTEQVPYSDQPYLPVPLPPTLTAAPNTTDLIYIDVWQREVTVLEDPSIREIALGGPDTTIRIQAVWQVRVLENVGQHGCGDDIASWDQTIAPSAGRLTTSAVAPPASDDPCIISPTGGYRGLENRLYRVEIHATGPIGGAAPAKFKWSRNNATIASTIFAIPSPTQITVQQIGRDQVLRFEVGNWIEITDDFREFQGLAGHMAQITAIDEANRILTFAPPIPGAMNFDATDPSRHTRVLRWDESQNVDANGLLDVTVGPIDIEDGIRVSFSLDPAGGNFKIGDYWVFAARTADGSVEILQDAPPRGILHHYCRLGFIHWGADLRRTTFTDCREHWPPEAQPVSDACCTEIVFPGESIQEAINRIARQGGGCVCLKAGEHRIEQPIRISSSNIYLHGESTAARVVRDSRSTLLIIGQPDGAVEDIMVDAIRFELQAMQSDPDVPAGLVVMNGVRRVTLKGCRVSAPETRFDLPAVSILSSSEVRIDGNTFSSTVHGVRAGGASRSLIIVDNTFTASQTRTAGQRIGGVFGVLFEEVSEASAIERNSFEGYQTAVQVRAAGRGPVHIAQNVVRRDPPPSPSVLEETNGFAIEVAAPGCLVRDNLIEIVAPEQGGILVQGDRACIEKNDIHGGARPETDRPLNLVGIAVRRLSARTPPQDPVVSANRVQVSEAGSLVTAVLVEDSDNARITGNDLEAEAPTRLGNGLQFVNVRGSFADSNRIVNATNAIFVSRSSSCRVRGNEISDSQVGIEARDQEALELLENTVENAAKAGIRLSNVAGTTRIAHNRLLLCGFGDAEGAAGAIAALLVSNAQGEVDVESNEITDSGLNRQGAPVGRAVHGISLEETPYLRIHGNMIRYREQPERLGIDPTLEHRALFVRVSIGDPEGVATNAQVLDNKFVGPGFSHLVEFRRMGDENQGFEKIIFSNNYCDHFNVERGEQDRDDTGALVSTATLWTRSLQERRGSLVVVGNQITTRGRIPAIDLNDRVRPTVVANSVRGSILRVNAEVPAPFVAFNVIFI